MHGRVISPPSSDEAGVSPRPPPAQLSRDPDVGKTRSEIRIHQDVLRLHVPVDDDRFSPRTRLWLVQVLLDRHRTDKIISYSRFI